jgi:hypothetical protein
MKFFLPLILIVLFSACGEKKSSTSEVITSDRTHVETPIFPGFSKNFLGRDSLPISFWTQFFWDAFNEKDLTIINGDSILRLSYSPGALDTAAPVILTLKRNEIIAKIGISKDLYTYSHTLLTEKEGEDLALLRRFYPFNDTSKYVRKRKPYLDSLSALNPKLLDPKYYHYLFQKSVGKLPPYTYRVTRTPLSNKDFEHVFDLLNISGYWALPYDLPCKRLPSDAGGFTLEGKTKNNFQLVLATDCPGDTSLFRKACEEMVKIAGLQDRIFVIWYE